MNRLVHKNACHYVTLFHALKDTFSVFWMDCEGSAHAPVHSYALKVIVICLSA